jgi:hypothetical protein
MFLTQYNFSKYGEFVFQKEQGPIRYQPNQTADCADAPKVYCWILRKTAKEELFQVLYVGKTKYTIKGRMGQHRQGFKQTKKGYQTAKLLSDLHSQGNVIEVWAREATHKHIEINGHRSEKEISHYSIEEEFFIALLEPQLNA